MRIEIAPENIFDENGGVPPVVHIPDTPWRIVPDQRLACSTFAQSPVLNVRQHATGLVAVLSCWKSLDRNFEPPESLRATKHVDEVVGTIEFQACGDVWWRLTGDGNELDLTGRPMLHTLRARSENTISPRVVWNISGSAAVAPSKVSEFGKKEAGMGLLLRSNSLHPFDILFLVSSREKDRSVPIRRIELEDQDQLSLFIDLKAKAVCWKRDEIARVRMGDCETGLAFDADCLAIG